MYIYSEQDIKQINELHDGQSLNLEDKNIKFSITCLVTNKSKCDECEFYHYNDSEVCQHIDCTKPNRIFIRNVLREQPLMLRPWLRK